jgi:type VI secretion system secreted protein VgrG
VFELSRSAVKRFDREYIVIGLRHRVEAEGHRSGDERDPRRVEVEAIPSDVAYRPRLVTPRPTTDGVETATVTGPAGKDFLVDEFGRVKVRFHWDRSPDAPGKTSCWMRVSHPSAGEGFGHVTLPRIGQEVVVDFLDGDPDRPIITGRVYNGQKKHTYPLSANETRSLWRSQTVGSSGDYGGAEKAPPATPGFNEIRFEDKGGKEELYVHAQREMVTDVLLDDKLTVQRDRKTRIGRDRTTEIKRHEKVTIEDGDETHTVKSGKRTTSIQQNETLTVEQGDMDTKVKMGNVKTEVSMGNVDGKVGMGNVTLKVDLGKVEIEAMQSITLKVGQSSVVIDQMGVTVKGLMVKSEAQIQNQTKGLMVQVEGSAMTTVKGGIVMIN